MSRPRSQILRTDDMVINIYQLPHEVIACIIKRVPELLHFILKCIKFFNPYIQTEMSPYWSSIHVIKNNYMNILREFCNNDFFKKSKIHLLCEYAISRNRLECLEFFISSGATYKPFWVPLAAEHSTKIFLYLLSKYKVEERIIHQSRNSAIFANNLDVLKKISNYPVTENEFMQAIQHGNLDVVKILAQDFWYENGDINYIQYARLYQKWNIVEYLSHCRYF